MDLNFGRGLNRAGGVVRLADVGVLVVRDHVADGQDGVVRDHGAAGRKVTVAAPPPDLWWRPTPYHTA